MKVKILLTGALVFIAALAAAQDDFGPKGPVVEMAPAPVVTAMQAKSVTVPLSFSVVGGYHINSNHPNSDYLIPTALKIDATTDIVIGRTTYPPGKDMTFPFAPDEKLNVYTGDFRIDVMVHPLRSVSPGKYVVRGTLKYQACDNKACYPPKSLPVSFDVRIAKAKAAAGRNPAQSPHVHH